MVEKRDGGDEQTKYCSKDNHQGCDRLRLKNFKSCPATATIANIHIAKSIGGLITYFMTKLLYRWN